MLIAEVSFLTNSFSQSSRDLHTYKAIVNYIQRDTVFSIDFVGKKCIDKKIAVSVHFIPISFKSVIDTDLSLLKIDKLDSLNKSLEKIDNEANLNFKLTNDALPPTLSTSKKIKYILYLSKPYKDLIYCELFPFKSKKNKKLTSFQTYRMEYMGRVATYMFTISNGNITNVKNGVYYMQ
ncbi:MAG: hypothetical protein JWR05_2837 [Mucilaginibacter sp.]|nr:hypothetical protein [Mucilaginibacter sp.]